MWYKRFDFDFKPTVFSIDDTSFSSRHTFKINVDRQDPQDFFGSPVKVTRLHLLWPLCQQDIGSLGILPTRNFVSNQMRLPFGFGNGTDIPSIIWHMIQYRETYAAWQICTWTELLERFKLISSFVGAISSLFQARVKPPTYLRLISSPFFEPHSSQIWHPSWSGDSAFQISGASSSFVWWHKRVSPLLSAHSGVSISWDDDTSILRFFCCFDSLLPDGSRDLSLLAMFFSIE